MPYLNFNSSALQDYLIEFFICFSGCLPETLGQELQNHILFFILESSQ